MNDLVIGIVGVGDDPEKALEDAEMKGFKNAVLLTEVKINREARDIARYLKKEETDLGLNEIGEIFGISYSGISHTKSRLKERKVMYELFIRKFVSIRNFVGVQ